LPLAVGREDYVVMPTFGDMKSSDDRTKQMKRHWDIISIKHDLFLDFGGVETKLQYMQSKE
jgi:hypothetical protein